MYKIVIFNIIISFVQISIFRGTSSMNSFYNLPKTQKHSFMPGTPIICFLFPYGVTYTDCAFLQYHWSMLKGPIRKVSKDYVLCHCPNSL